MNYEDEPYARAYTRDTATWKLMGFPARTVLLHMLRDRFDRSGVFDCEGHDPSQAVAAVTDVPVEIAAEGIARLVELGTWILSDGRIVWPNYLHAQTCNRSDRLRQAESRKNRRARALNSGPASPDPVSQGVTECHESSQESQSVTLSLAVLSLAEQSESSDARAPAAEEKSRIQNRAPEPEPEERETCIPLDLPERAQSAGLVAEFAGIARVPEAVIRAAVDEFVGYWTIGRGVGRKRAHWMAKLREHLRRAIDQNRLPAIGALEHERTRAEIEADRLRRRREVLRALPPPAEPKTHAERGAALLAASDALASVSRLGRAQGPPGIQNAAERTPGAVAGRRL